MGAFFLILLFLHGFLETGWGDDATFAGSGVPLGEFLAERYKTWTSRLAIEAGVKLLAAAPDLIWKALNILIILLLVWIVADLFGIGKMGPGSAKLQAEALFFLLLWSLPARSLCDAGWIATTMNYLWPLTLGLVAMRPIKHWSAGEKCPAWEYLACPLCMACAANVEQGAAVLLGACLLFGAYMARKGKKIPAFYFVLLFLALASVAFILTTPGNAYRFQVEMNQWFPGFDELGLSEKLLMGFIDSVNYYASAGGGERTNYLFALLAGILLAGAWQKRKEYEVPLKKIAKESIAFMPFLFYWGIGRLGNSLLQTDAFKRGGHIVGLFGKNRCLPTGAGAFDYLGWISYSRRMVLLQAGIYLGLIGCVIATITYLHGKSAETWLELLILGGGLASRVIMGLSPTLYASGERTSLYCSVAILIVCLRNLQIYLNGSSRKCEKAVLGIYVAGAICAGILSSGGIPAGGMLLFCL